jgi:nicotinate-nucleotide adenylyltransferase
MKLGILGGTFNPVHNGHLAVAEAVYSKLQPEKILLVPAYNPPHKDNEDIIPYVDRLNLVKLAVEPFDYLEVSQLDYTPGEKSYTKYLVQRLKKKYPEYSLIFILGADNIPQIQTWHDHHWLLENLKFAAVRRSDVEAEKFQKLPYFDQITLIDMEPVEVSSQMIRSRLVKGENIDGFVPRAVSDYISKKNLYKKSK